jgi:proteasome accessory factor B
MTGENLSQGPPVPYADAVQKVIERILNLLAFLLTVGRPVTADEIRHTVKGYDQPTDEAFRRTFERDKDLLRNLGVPLETTYTDVWEVELGYVVPSDRYTLDDPGLTDEERAALLLAAEAVRFGGQKTELDAVFKLGGAIRSRGNGPVLADLGNDLSTLGELFEAVSDRKRVTFAYRSKDRLVEPYGLVHRFGHWYLVGPEAGDAPTVKAFRLDRMQGTKVREAPHAYDRPKAFVLEDAVSDLAPDDDGQRALVRFDNRVVEIALRRSPHASVVESDDTTTLVELPLGATRSMISWLLGFDDLAVIEGPEALRASFLAFVEVPHGQ